MANANISQNFNLIIPAGTQIVTKIEVKNPATNQSWKPGAVGVIVQSPTDNSHAYLVKLPDGTEISLRRHELSIRKQFQSEGLQSKADFLAEYNLYDSVIYRCIVGSKAYGLDNAQSDTDRRGIYQPPANLHWSLYGIPEQLENKQNDECYWELQKFLIVALKGNPNVLECLYTPLVETLSPVAAELLEIREIFLSKLVYQTYNGYVLSQFKKMEQDLRNTGEVRSKHAMHLIRLLLSGITVLKEGFVPVRVDDYRSQLLSIRNQEVPWDEVNRWRLDLHREFDRAFGSTRLPERPNYEKANQFLIKARRSAIEN
ncbi:MAG: DNA polymerase beta superfamily protein [Microcoleus sp.]